MPQAASPELKKAKATAAVKSTNQSFRHNSTSRRPANETSRDERHAATCQWISEPVQSSLAHRPDKTLLVLPCLTWANSQIIAIPKTPRAVLRGNCLLSTTCATSSNRLRQFLQHPSPQLSASPAQPPPASPTPLIPFSPLSPTFSIFTRSTLDFVCPLPHSLFPPFF